MIQYPKWLDEIRAAYASAPVCTNYDVAIREETIKILLKHIRRLRHELEYGSPATHQSVLRSEAAPE